MDGVPNLLGSNVQYEENKLSNGDLSPRIRLGNIN